LLKFHPPYRLSVRDVVAVALLLTIIILLGLRAHQKIAPIVAVRQPPISLSVAALPGYAL
jgi:hypothetical protein